MFWPLEGMPQIIRYFSYISPFTYPSISVRNIMTKGFGITHPTVYLGFLVVIAWTGVLLWAGLQSLRIKKYSRNT
jgi:ABC-type multidrug transport system permease subunit